MVAETPANCTPINNGVTDFGTLYPQNHDMVHGFSVHSKINRSKFVINLSIMLRCKPYLQ